MGSGFYVRQKWALLISVSTAALVAGPVLAQVSGAAPAPTSASKNSSTGVSSVSEIVVNAQHRKERLRDVPISITAKTADQLEKSQVKNLGDLTSVVAGLRFDGGGVFSQPSLRGISSTVLGPNTDAPVALYLDGVYQPNQVDNNFELTDISRIEVYKGPQGTLYGRNATGGAIAIFTATPRFTPSAHFEVGYGNYNDKVLKAYLTGPLIGDVLAGSISGFYESHEDYTNDIVTHKHPIGLDSQEYRAKLLFQPTPNLTATLTMAYQDRYDTDGTSLISYHGDTVAKQDPFAIIPTQPGQSSHDPRAFAQTKEEDGNLHIDYHFDIGTLSSITSAKYSEDTNNNDDIEANAPTLGFFAPGVFSSGNQSTERQEEHNYAEDLTFSSRKFGGFSFVTGASYYYDNDAYADLTESVGPLAPGAPVTDIFEFNEKNPRLAGSAFAELTYELTSRFTLSVGARYNWEQASNNGNFVFFTPAPLPIPGLGNRAVIFRSTIPRVTARYKITDETNVYFTYSQGFKSGGLAATAFLAPPIGSKFPSFNPETVSAYEVGIKTGLGRWLTANVAAYYYDYKDLQVQIDLGGSNGNVVQNAATARIYGLDFDTTAVVTPGFTLTAAMSLTSAHYVKFQGFEALVPQSAGGNLPTPTDVSGYQLPRAPTATLSLNADYQKIFERGTLDLNATGYYVSEIYFDPAHEIKQTPYETLAAQISWKPINSNFSFAAWGKNITNTIYITSAFQDPNSTGVTYSPGATFGGTVKYSY